MIERWLVTEREHWEQFVGEPFVSCDPGSDGYALAWAPGKVEPIAFCHQLEPELLADLLFRVKARVLVSEAQYVRQLSNGGAMLELTLRSALSIGWAACRLHQDGTDLNLFQVSPSTWQAHQRHRVGRKGQAARGEGIAIALARAEQLIGDEQEWRKATKKRREGLASALGIAEHWRHLTGMPNAP